MKVTRFSPRYDGSVAQEGLTFEAAASHLLGNMINGLCVVSGWVEHADSDGAGGSSLVIVWGPVKDGGTRILLRWYEFDQPVSRYATGIQG